jgi:hypothetical protein
LVREDVRWTTNGGGSAVSSKGGGAMAMDKLRRE